MKLVSEYMLAHLIGTTTGILIVLEFSHSLSVDSDVYSILATVGTVFALTSALVAYFVTAIYDPVPPPKSILTYVVAPYLILGALFWAPAIVRWIATASFDMPDPITLVAVVLIILGYVGAIMLADGGEK